MKKIISFIFIIYFTFVTVKAQWETCNVGLPAKKILCVAVKDTFVFAGTQNEMIVSGVNVNNWTKTMLTKNNVSTITINGDDIFVTTMSGILYSTDNGNNWIKTGLTLPDVNTIDINSDTIIAGTNGNCLYLSTDYGMNWSKIISFNNYYPITKILIKANYIFAGTFGGGFYMSSNNGQDWIERNSGLTNANIITFTIKENKIFVCTDGGIFVSENNGDSWAEKNSGLNNKKINSIAISGENIIVGSNGGVYLSTDNGENWIEKNYRLTELTVNSFVINGNDIYAGTNSGVFHSTDNCRSWTEINSGLTKCEVRVIRANGNDLYAGTVNDCGIYLSTNNGISWLNKTPSFMAENKDNYFSSIVFDTDKIIAVTTTGNFLLLSTDKGNNWIKKNTGLINIHLRSLFSSSGVIYAVSDSGVFHTYNMGDTWQGKNFGLTKPNLYSIVVIDKMIFAGGISATSDKGCIYLSTDLGDNWSEIKVFNTNYYINSLYKNGNNIYAAGYGIGLYISNEYGSNWEDITNGLKKTEIYCLSFSGNNIFAGSYHGLFISTNMGSYWYWGNLTGTAVMSLANNGSYLFAGTGNGYEESGKGIYRAKISDFALGVIESKPNDNFLKIYPDPASDYIEIQFDRWTPSQKISIYNILGECIKLVEQTSSSVPRINISDLSHGIYFVRFGNQTKMFVKE